VTVVLYHMFEAYVEIEEANLVAADIAKGFASFIVVAGGGTVIGIVWGYVTGFVTRFARLSHRHRLGIRHRLCHKVRKIRIRSVPYGISLQDPYPDPREDLFFDINV
jgi:hypothetical protein